VRASLNYGALEAPQVGGSRSAADLSCGHERGAQQSLEEVNSEVERLSEPEPGVAAESGSTSLPFFRYPAAFRQGDLYHNSVEALHRSCAKINQTRGAFPNEESALKLYNSGQIRQASRVGPMPVQNWSQP